jgi:hypothetical protein
VLSDLISVADVPAAIQPGDATLVQDGQGDLDAQRCAVDPEL